jgi:trk/ktr system potassium uptake protein
MKCIMSTAPERSINYVLSKSVQRYMQKDLLVLDEDITTRTATRILQHYERDDIIVINSEKIPVGIVTDEDILNKVGDANINAETTSLKEIMTSPLITVGEHATLKEALHKMRDNKIRKLPVISDNNIVLGIISQGNIANVIRDATATPPRLLSPPIKAILGNLGFVLQFAGVLILVPAILATILGETISATGIYLSTVLLLVTGFFLNSYGEKASLNLQQASILVFASLFILILFGTIPYLYVVPINASNPFDMFANGFFSSAAGFTTGGISLFNTPEDLPQSFTFYRSYTQLVGGMSFIYLVITAFYPEGKLQSMRGLISGRTLHLRELFGTITIIFTVYIIIIALLLYFFGERNIIDNFSLAMSTVATGGFVPSSTIIPNLIWQEQLILMAGLILGALPFTFHYAFVKKRFLSPKLGKEVLVYFAVLSTSVLLFILVTGFDPLLGAFYTISASSTGGLQGDHLENLSGAGHLILTLLMFIGGCGFSTAGGIKIFRFFHIKDLGNIIIKEKRKQLTLEVKKDVASTTIIIVLFPLLTLVTAGQLMSISGADFGDAFFEATGVITTGGLSSGIIGFHTDPATKIGLSFLMIIGRLEIIAIVYIFVKKLAH